MNIEDLGGKVMSLAMLVWLSVSVGPWWVGALVFLAGLVLNLLVALAKKG